MSGRYSSQRGWEKPRTPSWVYALVGVLLTLVVVLAIVVFMLLGGDNAGLASATSTPTIPPSPAGPTSAATAPVASAGSTAAASALPTAQAPGATAVPSATTPEPGATGSPAASTKPTLVSITIPHKADCNGDNGTGSVGMITIAWTSTGATGVRISIDPPTAAGAYGYGYQDYLAPLTSATVPFACGSSLQDAGGSYHLYVVTTLHSTGYYQYRYQKVYQSPAPTPSP
jgi:hypothetical protein